MPAPSEGDYATVRINAMKHGVVSRLVVLRHEDGDEFDKIQSASRDEFQVIPMRPKHRPIRFHLGNRLENVVTPH